MAVNLIPVDHMPMDQIAAVGQMMAPKCNCSAIVQPFMVTISCNQTSFTATKSRYFEIQPRHCRDISKFSPRHCRDICNFYRDTAAIFSVFACRGAAIFCLFDRDKYLPLRRTDKRKVCWGTVGAQLGHTFSLRQG